MEMVKIGSSEYPKAVIDEFAANLPYTAQRLERYLTGQTNDPRAKHMLDAFHEGWKAAVKRCEARMKQIVPRYTPGMFDNLDQVE